MFVSRKCTFYYGNVGKHHHVETLICQKLVEEGINDTIFNQPTPHIHFQCPFHDGPHVAVVLVDFATQVEVCLVRETDSIQMQSVLINA